MIYEYNCKKCNQSVDIFKKLKDIAKSEYCEFCNNKLDRIFSTAGFIMSNGHYFDTGLNKYIDNPNEVKEHLKKINSETGSDYQIFGNEKIKKPKKKGYKLTRNEIEYTNSVLGD